MRILSLFFLTTGLVFSQTPDEIVKKAIEESVGLEKEGKVVKKPNGDIEIVYNTAMGKIAIKESKGVDCACKVCDCDGCQCKPGTKCDNNGCKKLPVITHKLNDQDTSPLAGDHCILINGKEWNVKGHSEKCADAAIQYQGGIPVFLNSDKQPIKPPAWYTGKYSLNKLEVSKLKPNKLESNFQVPVTTQVTHVPNVTIRPQVVRGPGSWPASMVMGRTPTSVQNVGQDGCIRGG